LGKKWVQGKVPGRDKVEVEAEAAEGEEALRAVA
jgi:hypothetical protein